MVEQGQTLLKIYMTGIGNIMKLVMTFVSRYRETWPLASFEEPLQKAYENDRLVYLTYESVNLLEVPDPQDIYVIGGVVDQGRLKCVTVTQA